VIDLHSHVLFGVDDGPETLEGSLAICAAAVADGTTMLAATPHVRDDYPTTPEMMEARLAEVQAAVGDGLRLLPGGELDLAELVRPPNELRRFALAGNPDYLLVETPYVGWPLEFGDRVFRLAAAGIRAVIAHPERNSDVQERPELLERLVAGGAICQLTAASVDGRLGPRTRKTAHLLIERGLAHMIASDAHELFVREIGMTSAVAAVGNESLARYLTFDVPRAIVEGGALPERPDSLTWRGRLRGRSRSGR
jgi:protein-tyrosine phosphatase